MRDLFADQTQEEPMSDPHRARPNIRGYGIHEQDEGLLSWEWVSEQMAKSRNYWICSTRPDGTPHAAPVWGVWLDGTLYFGTSRTSRKGRNFAQNPNVVAHPESGDDTVIIEGTVEEVTDPALFTRIADAYEAKYPPYRPDPAAEPGSVFYAVRPRAAFAWREKDYPKTATRWTFGEAQNRP
jgi:nitroimidazol reductase NimA-like FMN-containing flavoprotein (pyridoxamine 5'-phosphate oxidase superfamily)